MDTSKVEYKAHLPDADGYINYTATENETWQILYQRQIILIKSRACSSYLEGMKLLNLSPIVIPQVKDVSAALKKITGWSVCPVPALIDFKLFFELLAAKQFPAASFIRRREDLDYLQEPDIFHEIFGHCPLLTNHDYADFTQQVGKLAANFAPEDQALLARLYWFTVEFGLINQVIADKKVLKIYGAGILSSKTESVYALESSIPLRKPFDLAEILSTNYRYDQLQKIYFVIDDFKQIYQILDHDLLQLFAEVRNKKPKL